MNRLTWETEGDGSVTLKERGLVLAEINRESDTAYWLQVRCFAGDTMHGLPPYDSLEAAKSIGEDCAADYLEERRQQWQADLDVSGDGPEGSENHAAWLREQAFSLKPPSL